MSAVQEYQPRQERVDDASRRPEEVPRGNVLRRTMTWAAQNRLLAATAMVAAAISISALIAGGLWIVRESQARGRVTLPQVLDALDSGALTQAKEAANTLRNQKGASFDDVAGAVYALGVATAMEAEDTWSKDKQQRYLLAARYLEEARSRGFPSGRRAQGLYLLGKCLFEGGRIVASRPFLTAALRADPANRDEIYYLLAAAYREEPTPDLEKALRYNTLYLEERTLAPIRHQEGLMQRAQILLAMGKADECMATLQRIPPKSPLRAEATVLHGRVQMHQAAVLKNEADSSPHRLEQSRLKYEEAIKTLQLAQGRDTLTNQATRKAIYLIGVCLKEIGDYRGALQQFVRTRQLFPETPESVAASFEEAEIARDLGRDDDAVAGYRRALKALVDPRTFSNPWINVRNMQIRMLEAYEYYIKTQNYAVALEVAKLLSPLFPEVRSLELKAEVHRAWGQALLAEAEKHGPDKAEPLLREGRRQFRDAGRIQARLAELLITTRRYSDQLWESGRDYMQGQSYAAAMGMLKEYLKDQARRRHPQALVMLGEACLAQGKTEEALEAFQECVDFHPRDAAAYQARLLASRAWRENGEPAEAEKLLLENLAGEYLTPASQQWRESLFDLGELLYQEGRYDDARIRMEEAVERYPDDPRALTARYLLAESGRRAAVEHLQEDLAGSSNPALTQRITRLYEEALHEFASLRDMLSDWQQSRNLTDSERAVLRNTCFAIGDIEFALGRFSRAIDAYSIVTNRYQNAPEVLDAYVQIANAYRELGDSAQARSALEQARAVLNRMTPDAAFLDATNYDRAQWSEFLDYLSDL